MRVRGHAVGARADRSGPARRCRRGAPSPRARRAGAVDRAGSQRRAGSREAGDHRPRDRRPADLERGRLGPDRRQRRVLRLRGDSRRAGAARASLPHPVRQRDRGPPVRGARPCLSVVAARRVRVRPVGPAAAPAVRRARPVRHQAALLRDRSRRALPGVGGEGAARRRRAGALEPRTRLRRRHRSHSLQPVRRRRHQHALRRCGPGAAGPLPARGAGCAAADGRLLGTALRRRAGGFSRRGGRAGARQAGPGGRAAPARRRAGRLLRQPRHRLGRGARAGRASLAAPGDRVHHDLRRAGVRRERRRDGDRAPRRRRLRPDPGRLPPDG